MGVTFNGIHSNTLGLERVSSTRPIMPESRDTYIDVPFKNGSILISDTSFLDIDVSVTFKVRKQTAQDLMGIMLQIRNWLTTEDRRELIFDDFPTHAYMGKVSSAIELEKVLATGTFTVVWRCVPDMIELPQEEEGN